MNEARNTFDDYLSKLASNASCVSNTLNACEAKRPPTVCETLARNRDRIVDIENGMDKLLELLIGPEKRDTCDTIDPPCCLQDEVAAQDIILGRIYYKLNKAYQALNG